MLINHSINKKKLLSDSAWAFSGKLVTIVISFIINLLLARLLSPQAIGNYFLIVSIISFAATFALLGLLKTSIILIAESLLDDKAKAKSSVILLLKITSIGILATGIILFFGLNEILPAKFSNLPNVTKLTSLIILWFALFTWQQLVAEIYRGYHNIKLATLFSGLFSSTLSATTFYYFYWHYGQIQLQDVIIITIIATCSSVLFSNTLLWLKLKDTPKYIKATSLSTIVTLSWPLWLTSLSFFIITQADIWLLGIFRSDEEIAIYGIASRLIVIISMPLLITNAVIPPRISQLYAQNNKQSLQHLLRLSASISGVFSLIGLCIFIFYGEDILHLLFGEFYQSGATILIVLSLGQAFNVCTGSCGLALMLTKHQKTMMTITLLTGTITITLSWHLVQSHGALGAAIGTSFGIVLQNIMMLLFARYKIGIWTHISPFILFNKE